MPLIGQQKPCNPPPGRCYKVEDCEGLEHPKCPGNWVCEQKCPALPGQCKWECSEYSDYCDSSEDCTLEPPFECEGGHYECVDHQCIYKCTKGFGFCETDEDCLCPDGECSKGLGVCSGGEYKCEEGRCVCHKRVQDADMDGLLDDQDPCPNDPYNDIDQDGVCGDVDNCPSIANPEQKDEDGDGYGDVCGSPGDNGARVTLEDYDAVVEVHTGGLSFEYPQEAEAQGMVIPKIEAGSLYADKFGDPALPVKEVLIHLPLDAVGVRVALGSLEVEEESTIQGIVVYPLQNPLKDGFEYNRCAYEPCGIASEEIPPTIPYHAEVIDQIRTGDWNVVRVLVRPFEFDPEHHVLKMAKVLRFRLLFDREDWIQPSPWPPDPEFVDGLFRGLVVNPDDLPHNIPLPARPKFLIVGPSDLQDFVYSHFVDLKPDAQEYDIEYLSTESVRQNQGIMSFSKYLRDLLQDEFRNSHLKYVLLIGDYYEIPPYAEPGTGIFGTDYSINTAIQIYGWMRWDPQNRYILVESNGWAQLTIGKNPEYQGTGNEAVAVCGWAETRFPDGKKHPSIGTPHGVDVLHPFRKDSDVNNTDFVEHHHCWVYLDHSPSYYGGVQIGRSWWIPYKLELIALHSSGSYSENLQLKVGRAATPPGGSSYRAYDISASALATRTQQGNFVPSTYKVKVKYLDKDLEEFDGKRGDETIDVLGLRMSLEVLAYLTAFKDMDQLPAQTIDLSQWEWTTQWSCDPKPANGWGIYEGGGPLRFAHNQERGDYPYTLLTNDDFPDIAVARLPVFGTLENKKLQLLKAFAKIIAYERGERVAGSQKVNGEFYPMFQPLPEFRLLASRTLYSSKGGGNPLQPISDLELGRRDMNPWLDNIWVFDGDILYNYGWFEYQSKGKWVIRGIDPLVGYVENPTLQVTAPLGNPYAYTNYLMGAQQTPNSPVPIPERPGVGYVFGAGHAGLDGGGFLSYSSGTFRYPGSCIQEVYPIVAILGCGAGKQELAMSLKKGSVLWRRALFDSICTGASQYVGAEVSHFGIGEAIANTYQHLLRRGDFKGRSSVYLWDLAVAYPSVGGLGYHQRCESFREVEDDYVHIQGWPHDHLHNTWLWMVYGDPTMKPVLPEDMDGDGVLDVDDLCPTLAQDTGDSDGDGIGDACDVDKNRPDPAQEIGDVRMSGGSWIYKASTDDMPQAFKEEFNPPLEIKGTPVVLDAHMKKDVTYRVRLFYSLEVSGILPDCKVDVGGTLISPSPEVQTVVVRGSGDGKLRISLKARLGTSCTMELEKLLVVPDRSYVFVGNEEKEEWKGIQAEVRSLVDPSRNRLPLGGDAWIVKGVRYMQYAQLIPRNGSVGNVLLSYNPQQGKAEKGYWKQTIGGVEWWSERDKSDWWNNPGVGDVVLDPALMKGRGYTIVIPYVVDTEPWFEGLPYSYVDQSLMDSNCPQEPFKTSREVILDCPSGEIREGLVEPNVMLSPLSARTHWEASSGERRVGSIQQAQVYFYVPEDGCVLRFRQHGYGKYLIDNIVVIDTGR